LLKSSTRLRWLVPEVGRRGVATTMEFGGDPHEQPEQPHGLWPVMVEECLGVGLQAIGQLAKVPVLGGLQVGVCRVHRLGPLWWCCLNQLKSSTRLGICQVET